ncbi:MAG: methyltransferase domain-containing protein [Rhodocyclaceae bacterium]|nr:methyltransferase domain-containing protein [Rhodocyclaceae bacterium]
MTDFGRRVAVRFDNAAASYDAHSAAQRHAARRLADRIVASSLPPRARVLEIGCGTGHLTELLALHLPGAHILATDIAPTMIQACQRRLAGRGNPSFAVMDGCRPASADFYDLICGNLVAQWFADLPGACARLAALLAPGGVLALCLPGAETFREWRAAHTQLGLAAGMLTLPTAKQCRAALPGDTHVAVEYWLDRPASGLDFLRALRAIGADTPAPGHVPLSPARLRRVLRTLGPAPTLSYELIFMHHRKP